MRSMLIFGLLLGACSHDLDPDVVTALPEGDARGSSHSGRYEVRAVVESCTGECPLIQSGWFTTSTCDVGEDWDDDIELVQVDGALSVDASETSLYVKQLKGGVFADGRFDVGGFATQMSGQVEITTRVEGTIDSNGAISATARAWAGGEVNETRIDCVANYSLSGARER